MDCGPRVVGHGTGQADECLIGYADVDASLFQAPTVTDLDRRVGQMADTRR
jgi:hypothetical protein